MKIRLSRLNTWLKRLQWPLAWRGFLKPAPLPAPVLAVAAPSLALNVSDTWEYQGQSEAGEPVRIVVPPHPEGGRHVVTGAHALYGDENAEGQLLVHGISDFAARKVKGARQMMWPGKGHKGGSGQPVEIILQGVPGVQGALSVCGYTQWEMPVTEGGHAED